MRIRQKMRRSARLLTAFAALALVLAPALADARPGGGVSSGSRGARTYSAPPSTNTYGGQVRPMERTTTPQSSPAATAGAASAAQPSRGLFGGGLMGGLMGGLLGAGLIGMLFGHGLFGGMSGMMGFFGFLLQIALIVLLVRFAIGFFRRRQQQNAPMGMRPAMAGGPDAMAREAERGQRGFGGFGGGAAPSAPPPVIGEADFKDFERALVTINGAWSAKDLNTLSRLATPEMVGYFRQDLSDLAARNWQNETRDVKLEQGDLAEAWSEGRTEYATVAMRFSLIDVTRDAAGTVVEGSPTQRQTVTELWTFARPVGGAWQLSAIQQTN
ncbi:TIM44-like domain-containing protein [Acetobacteraceae bacterium H6797]|nr:TIM44-like domain-containing protein [Acetobacteraceae bacterium H6797]